MASASKAEHRLHLEQFFLLLQENVLRINLAKCTFAAPAVDFLGHRMNAA
jgi:hypothetical protein